MDAARHELGRTTIFLKMEASLLGSSAFPGSVAMAYARTGGRLGATSPAINFLLIHRPYRPKHAHQYNPNIGKNCIS